jgi:hypothetical protein
MKTGNATEGGQALLKLACPEAETLNNFSRPVQDRDQVP